MKVAYLISKGVISASDCSWETIEFPPKPTADLPAAQPSLDQRLHAAIRAYKVLDDMVDQDLASWESLTALQQQSMKGAIDTLRSAAEQGRTSAKAHLAEIYYHGSGVLVDEDQAFALYLSAAEDGDADSQWNTARLYWHGEGCERSEDSARAWRDQWAKITPPGAERDCRLDSALWTHPAPTSHTMLSTSDPRFPAVAMSGGASKSGGEGGEGRRMEGVAPPSHRRPVCHSGEGHTSEVDMTIDSGESEEDDQETRNLFGSGLHISTNKKFHFEFVHGRFCGRLAPKDYLSLQDGHELTTNMLDFLLGRLPTELGNWRVGAREKVIFVRSNFFEWARGVVLEEGGSLQDDDPRVWSCTDMAARVGTTDQKAALVQAEIIFIPAVYSGHCSLVLLLFDDRKTKATLLHLDSWRGTHAKATVIGALTQWVTVIAGHGNEVTVDYVEMDVLQQTDVWACGVQVLENARIVCDYARELLTADRESVEDFVMMHIHRSDATGKQADEALATKLRNLPAGDSENRNLARTRCRAAFVEWARIALACEEGGKSSSEEQTESILRTDVNEDEPDADDGADDNANLDATYDPGLPADAINHALGFLDLVGDDAIDHALGFLDLVGDAQARPVCRKFDAVPRRRFSFESDLQFHECNLGQAMRSFFLGRSSIERRGVIVLNDRDYRGLVRASEGLPEWDRHDLYHLVVWLQGHEDWRVERVLSALRAAVTAPVPVQNALFGNWGRHFALLYYLDRGETMPRLECNEMRDYYISRGRPVPTSDQLEVLQIQYHEEDNIPPADYDEFANELAGHYDPDFDDHGANDSEPDGDMDESQPASDNDKRGGKVPNSSACAASASAAEGAPSSSASAASASAAEGAPSSSACAASASADEGAHTSGFVMQRGRERRRGSDGYSSDSSAELMDIDELCAGSQGRMRARVTRLAMGRPDEAEAEAIQRALSDSTGMVEDRVLGHKRGREAEEVADEKEEEQEWEDEEEMEELEEEKAKEGKKRANSNHRG